MLVGGFQRKLDPLGFYLAQNMAALPERDRAWEVGYVFFLFLFTVLKICLTTTDSDTPHSNLVMSTGS